MKNVDFIEITTNMGCKNNCLYCPQNKLLNKYFKDNKNRKSEMTLDDFKKMLPHIPKNLHLFFTGMSEPFQAKDCMDMILYALNKGYKAVVHTTLRGLDINDISKLNHENLIFSLVHLPDKDGMLQLKVDDEYIAKVKKYKEVLGDKAKWLCIGNIHPEIQKCFDRKFASAPIITRGNSIDKSKFPKDVVFVDAEEINFSNNIPIFCGRIFEGTLPANDKMNQFPGIPHMFIVLPDGTVLLCCNDYGMEHVLGNIYDQTYEQIRSGMPLKTIEEKMSGKNQGYLLCRNCEWAKKYDSKKWSNYLKTGQYIPDKTKKEIIKSFIQSVFSIKNDYDHKIITIAGIKIKIKKRPWCPIDAYKKELPAARKLLKDDLSRKVFDKRLKYLQGDSVNTVIPQSSYEEYYHPEVHPENGDIVIDAGVSEWIEPTIMFSQTVGENGKVIGFEPEPVGYKAAIEQTKAYRNIEIHPVGLWDKDDVLKIAQTGRSSSIVRGEEGSVLIDCKLTTLDKFVAENNIKKVDFIKMDIEGAEPEALAGSAETIKAFRPKLAICVYHKPEHICQLILYINSLNLGYKFWMGHHRDNFWSTVLYAKVIK